MKNVDDLKNSPMGDALVELDNIMNKTDCPPITLNIVGGFAMMIHGLRKVTEETDIDFVGYELPIKIKSISDMVGQKHGLGTDWINNDLMLSGITLDDFELSTGKLHFVRAFKLHKITVNVLIREDLLRLKLIALDTALTAVELGGDFSRMKDVPDTIKLLENLETEIKAAMQDNSFYVRNQNIPTILNLYKKEGPEAVSKYIANIAEENLAKLRQSNKEYKRSSLIEDMLNDAFRRASEQNFDDI